MTLFDFLAEQSAHDVRSTARRATWYVLSLEPVSATLMAASSGLHAMVWAGATVGRWLHRRSVGGELE